MYDKVLAKDEFVAKLKEAGFTDDEIKGLWVNLERQFYSQMLLNSAKALTKEQLKEAVGADELGPEDLDQMVRNLGNYVQKHVGELDSMGIIRKSAQEAHKNLANLIMN